jgi:hypothetical protein
MSNTRKALGSYEVRNLLFFMCFIGALIVLGAFVFRGYKDLGKVPPKEIDPSGIMDEVVSSTSSSCYFYMGAKLTDTVHKYRNRQEVPATDVLATNLFNITGVIQVTVDQTMIVLLKAPKAHWEEIRPQARDVITSYLHPEKKSQQGKD